MKKTELISFFSDLRDFPTENRRHSEKKLTDIATNYGIDFDIVSEFNQLISLTYTEIEERGGIEKYIHSDTSWLKSELELLLLSYHFCSDYGLKIADISVMLSLSETALFAKTPSQLQNTFYKLKKNEIKVEDIHKRKPGRKRKSKEEKLTQQKLKQQNKQKTTHNYSNPEIVRLFSDTMNNIQLLSHSPKNAEKITDVYQLINGLHTLSSIAVDTSNTQASQESTMNDYLRLKSRLFTLELELNQAKKQQHCLQHLLSQYLFNEGQSDRLNEMNFKQKASDLLNKQGINQENHQQFEYSSEELKIQNS